MTEELSIVDSVLERSIHLLRNTVNEENSTELGHLNSTQTGQLNPLQI